MGFSSSKEKQNKAQELKNIINKCQKECYSESSEMLYRIRENKNEVIRYLKKNELGSAKKLMNSIIKNENIFPLYELMDSNLEILKEKCSAMVSSQECPVQLKIPLNTILFVANESGGWELRKFIDKIAELYGSEYVTQAKNNTDKLVNEELIKKSREEISEELVETRIKRIIKVKNLKVSLNANSYNVFTQVTSNVNECFYKTKVTQKFSNPLDNALELKIYIFKKENIIFSSFECQIGDSIKVKSKVIKEEKAKEKYGDSIASGNAAIFVTHDPLDKNTIIINMGNLHQLIICTLCFLNVNL